MKPKKAKHLLLKNIEKRIFFLWLFLTSICSSFIAYSQPSASDTAFIKESIMAAVGRYKLSVEGRAHLYIGQEYVDYRIRHREGDQFYISENFTEGAVQFEGIWYEPVSLLYDIVRDEVVLQLHPSMMKQKLISEKVRSFRIYGHTFVRLTPDSLAGSNLKAGFYDVLYQQPSLTLFARRTKNMEEEIGLNMIKQIFTGQTEYFIRKEERFTKVKSKQDLYKLLSAHRKELRKFARAGKLNFRVNKETYFLSVLEYYNTLSR